jgi:hypothetical protein
MENYPGVMPVDRDIIDIVKDGRIFACPELTRRYGDQRNIPEVGGVSYYFFKVTPPGEWGGWKDWVPDRIGRAACCSAFGYNRNDGLYPYGGSAPAGVNGEPPSPPFGVRRGGPDRTRATLHLAWQSTDL